MDPRWTPALRKTLEGKSHYCVMLSVSKSSTITQSQSFPGNSSGLKSAFAKRRFRDGRPNHRNKVLRRTLVQVLPFVGPRQFRFYKKCLLCIMDTHLLRMVTRGFSTWRLVIARKNIVVLIRNWFSNPLG